MSVYKKQIGGSHYKDMKIQPSEFVNRNKLLFAEGNAIKYIRKMRANGEQLNKEPRILLSTIHGVKGGEKENVVLLTDLSNNTQKNMDRFPDDENRLFYVGATRTKDHLHIIRPKDIYKSFRI